MAAIHPTERRDRTDDRLDPWPESRIERELLEIQRAKATCIPRSDR
ncbi:hypothetical protein [Natrinema gari]|nr:hypothetical protein [Natrinema gari]